MRATAVIGIAALAGAVIFLSIINSKKASARDSEYLEKARNQLIRVLSINLNGIENLSFQFIANRDLNDLLREYTESPERYQIFRWNRIFTEYLESHQGANPALRDAVFFDGEEPRRKPLAMSENLDRDTIRAIRESPFLKELLGADGKAIWSKDIITDGEGRRILLCGRALRHYGTRRMLGAFILLVDPRRLAEIANSDLYVDGDFDESMVGNYFNLIIAGDGMILASPVGDHVGRSIGTVLTDAGSLVRDLALAGEEGMGTAVWKGSRVTARFVRILKGSDFFLLEIAAQFPGGTVPLPSSTMPAVSLVILGLAVLGAWAWYRGANGRGNLDQEPAPQWLERLNPREREILFLVAGGQSNKEIAFNLHLKEQTVKNYIRLMYEKLGVHDRVSATLMAAGYRDTNPP